MSSKKLSCMQCMWNEQLLIIVCHFHSHILVDPVHGGSLKRGYTIPSNGWPSCSFLSKNHHKSIINRAYMGIPTIFIKHNHIVGGFNPSEKYESQLGLLFPIYGEKNMFQATKQHSYCWWIYPVPSPTKIPMIAGCMIAGCISPIAFRVKRFNYPIPKGTRCEIPRYF